MGTIASQITSLTIVYSTVYSDADQRKHQSSASLVFVRGIYRGQVNSPHKGPGMRKMFPFDDVIMRGWKPPGPRFSIKTTFPGYRNSHFDCKTAVKQQYFGIYIYFPFFVELAPRNYLQLNLVLYRIDVEFSRWFLVRDWPRYYLWGVS